jgi:hypothetical protein
VWLQVCNLLGGVCLLFFLKGLALRSTSRLLLVFNILSLGQWFLSHTSIMLLTINIPGLKTLTVFGGW